MKKLFIGIILLLLITNLVFASQARILFEKIRAKNDEYMPKSFSAVVNSDEVRRGLGTVPPRERLGRLYLLFMFHKEYGERLLIKNTTDNHKNMYAAYLSLYNDFKIFLKKDRTYQDFTAVYNWEIFRENAFQYQIKMQKKRNRAGDYFLLHVNKNSLLITHVEKFTNGRVTDFYRLNYAQIGRYRILNSFTFNGIIKGKRVYVSFFFSDFKINVNFTESNFYE